MVILQCDGQTLELVEVTDYLFDALLRIPYKAESELSGFFVDKSDFDIVVSGYLWEHFFQWDVVVDDRLHGEGILWE